MDILKLGYTQKWIDLGFLDEETLSKQITEFEKGDGKNAEDFRNSTFKNWLKGKKKLTNKEVNNYIELAKDDTDDRLSGAAIKDLFVFSKISDEQFEMVKSRLPEFGEWTKKLIAREDLTRRLNKEELTSELFDACLKYKKMFNDNRLLISIIQSSEDVDVLSRFQQIEIGKKIKTLASNKTKKLKQAISKD